MRNQRGKPLASLIAAGLSLGAASAQAGYLLKENFDAGVATYTPAGTVNLRPISDLIYTSTATGFDSYTGFQGSFLVLGDTDGALPGGPSGTVAGSTSRASFALGQFYAGTHRLSIAFDYAFDTNLAPGTVAPLIRNLDDFFVQLQGSGGAVIELLRFDDVLRNETDRKGRFEQGVTFELPAAQSLSLAFALTEYSGTNGAGDSAVGIDNVQVLSESSSIALFGLGMLGMGRLRRRSTEPSNQSR